MLYNSQIILEWEFRGVELLHQGMGVKLYTVGI